MLLVGGDGGTVAVDGAALAAASGTCRAMLTGAWAAASRGAGEGEAGEAEERLELPALPTHALAVVAEWLAEGTLTTLAAEDCLQVMFAGHFLDMPPAFTADCARVVAAHMDALDGFGELPPPLVDAVLDAADGAGLARAERLLVREDAAGTYDLAARWHRLAADAGDGSEDLWTAKRACLERACDAQVAQWTAETCVDDEAVHDVLELMAPHVARFRLRASRLQPAVLGALGGGLAACRSVDLSRTRIGGPAVASFLRGLSGRRVTGLRVAACGLDAALLQPLVVALVAADARCRSERAATRRAAAGQVQIVAQLDESVRELLAGERPANRPSMRRGETRRFASRSAPEPLGDVGGVPASPRAELAPIDVPLRSPARRLTDDVHLGGKLRSSSSGFRSPRHAAADVATTPPARPAFASPRARPVLPPAAGGDAPPMQPGGSRTPPMLVNLSHNAIGESGLLGAVSLLRAGGLPVRLLDVSDNALGEAGAATLADALRANETLTWLACANCRFGASGLQAVALAASENCALVHLDVGGNVPAASKGFGVEALAVLVRRNRTLTSLSIARNAVVAGAKALAAAVRDNDVLTALDVSGTELYRQQAAGLLAIGLQRSRALRRLSLAGNRIAANVTIAYATVLVQLQQLDELDLSGNGIDAVTAAGFATALSRQQQLRVLRLRGPADGRTATMGNDGSLALAKGLANHASLEELDIGGQQVRDSGFSALMRAVRTMPRLRLLVARENLVASSGAVMAARVGNRIAHRLEIDLSGNPVPVDGFEALGTAACMNSLFAFTCDAPDYASS